MIIQPEWGSRNVNEQFYESEARRIAILNEIFHDVELSKAEMRTLVWLAGWEESTVINVVSAIRKVTLKNGKAAVWFLAPGRAQWQLLIRNVKSAFAFTFGKSNKTCAVSGADKQSLRGGSYWLKRTISGMVGKGSIYHNERRFAAENVDKSRMKDNIVFIREDIKSVYHDLFDAALERYNAKQKRKDRSDNFRLL